MMMIGQRWMACNALRCCLVPLYRCISPIWALYLLSCNACFPTHFACSRRPDQQLCVIQPPRILPTTRLLDAGET
jgi:hypothetical protein